VVLDAAGFVDDIVTVMRVADTVTGRNGLFTEAAYRVPDSFSRGVQVNNLHRGDRKPVGAVTFLGPRQRSFGV